MPKVKKAEGKVHNSSVTGLKLSKAEKETVRKNAKTVGPQRGRKRKLDKTETSEIISTNRESESPATNINTYSEGIFDMIESEVQKIKSSSMKSHRNGQSSSSPSELESGPPIVSPSKQKTKNTTEIRENPSKENPFVQDTAKKLHEAIQNNIISAAEYAQKKMMNKSVEVEKKVVNRKKSMMDEEDQTIKKNLMKGRQQTDKKQQTNRNQAKEDNGKDKRIDTEKINQLKQVGKTQNEKIREEVEEDEDEDDEEEDDDYEEHFAKPEKKSRLRRDPNDAKNWKFKCKKCDFTFQTSEKLKKHSLKHKKNVSQSLCRVCGKHIKYNYNLKNHVLKCAKAKQEEFGEQVLYDHYPIFLMKIEKCIENPTLKMPKLPPPYKMDKRGKVTGFDPRLPIDLDDISRTVEESENIGKKGSNFTFKHNEKTVPRRQLKLDPTWFDIEEEAYSDATDYLRNSYPSDRDVAFEELDDLDDDLQVKINGIVVSEDILNDDHIGDEDPILDGFDDENISIHPDKFTKEADIIESSQEKDQTPEDDGEDKDDDEELEIPGDKDCNNSKEKDDLNNHTDYNNPENDDNVYNDSDDGESLLSRPISNFSEEKEMEN